MREEINLAQTTRSQRKVVGKLFIISLGVFIVLFSIAALLVLYSFSLKTRVSALDREISTLRLQISSYAKQKEAMVVINERLAAIRKVIASRNKIDLWVESVVAFVPDVFGIESIKADPRLVSIAISSPKLSDFDSFLEGKVLTFSKDNNLNIGQINIGYFIREGNEYKLSLDFYITSQVESQ